MFVEPVLSLDRPLPYPDESHVLGARELCEADMAKETDPGYKKYVTSWFVTMAGSDEEVPVKILRDSGALDSFILALVLPFTSETNTGEAVLVRGMGLTVLSVPLHNVVLSSDLVNGEVALGV